MAGIKGVNHKSFAVKDLDAALRNAVEVLGGGIMMKFEETNLKYRKVSRCTVR